MIICISLFFKIYFQLLLPDDVFICYPYYQKPYDFKVEPEMNPIDSGDNLFAINDLTNKLFWSLRYSLLVICPFVTIWSFPMSCSSLMPNWLCPLDKDSHWVKFTVISQRYQQSQILPKRNILFWNSPKKVFNYISIRRES